ncbi:MAG: hypothetical protein ABI548_24735 [Polyangiaceae bacterium]
MNRLSIVTLFGRFSVSSAASAWVRSAVARSMAVASVGACVFWSASARAWYFPEHAELTRLALRDYAPRFVTEEIESVAAEAADDGVEVCPEAITALRVDPPRDDCVPYGALAALAGDHANTAADLRAALSQKLSRFTPMPNRTLGALVTDAARSTWVAFLADGRPEELRVWSKGISTIEGTSDVGPRSTVARDYVRTLDTKLQVIDHNYTSRAAGAKTHFHDATLSTSAILTQASVGDLDNALAQLVAHHVRSLQLAVASTHFLGKENAKVRRWLRTEALLEHAFALHFVEDGFAAGHIATDPAVQDAVHRAQRHDFFNRQGLAVTRAMTDVRCQRQDAPDTARSTGSSPCWVAHGDGFAGASDRTHVEEAIAILQTSFALALKSTKAVEQLVQRQVEDPACSLWEANRNVAAPDDCDLAWGAILLNPYPQWVRSPVRTTQLACDLHDNGCWAQDIVLSFRGALESIVTQPWVKPADAGSAATQQGAVTGAVLGEPLSTVSAGTKPKGLDLVWLPVLANWPAAQTDVTTLGGADDFGYGLKVQVLASAAASYSSPIRNSSRLTSWGGVGLGFALRTQGVFPHRYARDLIEVNGGVAQGLLVAGQADRAANRFPSVAVFEVRSPISTLLLYGTGWLWKTGGPINLVGTDTSFGIFGGRLYYSLANEQLRLTGWDVEIMDIMFGKQDIPRSASRSGLIDPEGRLRLGFRSSDPLVPLSKPFNKEFTITFEANSGLFAPLVN